MASLSLVDSAARPGPWVSKAIELGSDFPNFLEYHLGFSFAILFYTKSLPRSVPKNNFPCPTILEVKKAVPAPVANEKGT